MTSVDSNSVDDLPRSVLGDAGAMLDRRAKDAYRRRLAEIEDDSAQALAVGDDERAAQADAERDFLVQELAARSAWVVVIDEPRQRRSALAWR